MIERLNLLNKLKIILVNFCKRFENKILNYNNNLNNMQLIQDSKENQLLQLPDKNQDISKSMNN